MAPRVKLQFRSVVLSAWMLLFVGCGGLGVADVDAGNPQEDGSSRDDGRVISLDANDHDAGEDAGTDAGIDDSVVDCDERPIGTATREVGAGKTYTTIAQAIAAAGAGDVVLVHAGTYPEQVTIDKSITIAPYGDGEVWIDGECSDGHPTGILIRAPNVRVRCFGVRNTVQASVLVSGSGAHDVTIEGMKLQDFQCMQNLPDGNAEHAGVAAYYTGPGIRVVGNTIRRRVDVEGDPRGNAYGVWFKSNEERPSGGGHYIGYNTIEGGHNGIGGVDGDDRGGFDRESTIEHNDIRDCADDGIHSEGGNQDIVIRDNHIQGCFNGISFAPTRIGPLTIERNVIENLTATPGGKCFEVGEGGTGTAYLRHNVCRISTGAGIAQTDFGNNTYVVEQNIFQVGQYVYELVDAVTVETTFRWNCTFTSDTTRFVKWAGVRYYTLAEFQTNTGQEEGSQQTTDCSWLED